MADFLAKTGNVSIFKFQLQYRMLHSWAWETIPTENVLHKIRVLLTHSLARSRTQPHRSRLHSNCTEYFLKYTPSDRSMSLLSQVLWVFCCGGHVAIGLPVSRTSVYGRSGDCLSFSCDIMIVGVVKGRWNGGDVAHWHQVLWVLHTVPCIKTINESPLARFAWKGAGTLTWDILVHILCNQREYLKTLHWNHGIKSVAVSVKWQLLLL